MCTKYNKYIVQFFSAKRGGENNPVKSPISDQHSCYAKYNKNVPKRINYYSMFFLISLYFILNNSTFLRQNLIKIYIKTHQMASIISSFFGQYAPKLPSMCAADIIFSL